MQSGPVLLGLLSAILLSTETVAHPNPVPNPGAYPTAVSYPAPAPYPMAYPYADPNGCCTGRGYGCGLGLCQCCGGTTCENGACQPIVSYADGFYGPPRKCGGYGDTFCYGK